VKKVPVVCGVCGRPPLTKAAPGEHCQRDCTGLDCEGRYVKKRRAERKERG
jgi:hypothetical protein